MNIKSILKTSITAVLALSLGLMLTGCATIIHGEHEDFTLRSKPDHARITIDGVAYGKTPALLKLKRKDDHDITISMPGYQPQTITLQSTLSGWVFGNLVFGGIIGIAVDAGDGAMYKLTPAQVRQYTGKSYRYNDSKNVITVFLTHKPHRNWKRIGRLKRS